MRLVSFDAFRTLAIPGVHYIKPEHYLAHLPVIEQADWVLFPEYWQLHALHYGLGARVFPSLASYHLGHNKIEMTRAFQLLCPLHIPDTLIYPNTPEYSARVLAHFGFPFVAKTPRASEGRGVFLIENTADWRRYCASHTELYAQELLPIDRDLRLVVIGDQVIGGYWRLQGPDGFHNNIAQSGELMLGALPPAALELVEGLSRRLGVNHAGFDVAMVGNHPYLLEFNRLFGNHGLVEQGIQPAEQIYRHLLESLSPKRTPPVTPCLRWAR